MTGHKWRPQSLQTGSHRTNYFNQNKDQLQNPPEVTGIHKVSSQSDLINKK